MRRLLLAFCALLVTAACGGDDNNPNLAPTTAAPYSQTDLVVGTGALAGPGTLVTVAYIGWLHDSSRTDAKGTQFDANTAFTFRLGTGAVIRGWDQGVSGMRVGGQRRLVIPPDLAYGNQSPPGSIIPPNATLVFDITLNNVQ
jgi:FKBP-type peptidyl-prolyl cis-trans isomerase FkpA